MQIKSGKVVHYEIKGPTHMFSLDTSTDVTRMSC